MANQTTLTFGGDAAALEKAAARATAATQGVGDQAQRTSGDLQAGARAAQDQESRLTRLGATTAGVSAAMGDAGGALTSVNDLMNRGTDRAMEHARALADVEQAQLDSGQAARDLDQAQTDVAQALLDVRQAGRDAAQAAIDVEQAQLDSEQAAADYAAAVAEHGKTSREARQAMIDQKQAQEDLKQAQLDASQAQHDQNQAQLDSKQYGHDAAQAQRDAADAALNLAEAQRAANPPALGTWARDLQLATDVAAGLAGTVGLLAMAHNTLSLATIRATAATVASRVATIASSVAAGVATAAQWLWNIALTANPIGIIVVAIGALIAAIVLIATKTDWFQRLWTVSWDTAKGAVMAVWGWIRDTLWPGIQGVTAKIGSGFSAIPGRIRSAFSTLVGIISAPFKTAFNFIARAWNSTIGRLRWSVPDWVPSIGGNSVGAPQLPTYQTGTMRVPGAPGQSMLAVLHAGERVDTARSAGGSAVIEIRSGGARLDDLLVEVLSRAVGHRGGNVQHVLGGR